MYRGNGRSRALFALAAAAVLATVAGGTTPAGADPGGNPATNGKGTASVYQPERGPQCSLHPAASHSPLDEWSGCLAVAAALDRAPAIGETAPLRVRVSVDAKADPSLGATDIRIELPPQLAWAQAPSGARVAAVRSRAPERAGDLSVAGLSRALRSGAVADLTGVVRAVSAGATEIQVHASVTGRSGPQIADDQVFLTVGERGAPSRLGQPLRTGPAPVVPVTDTSRVARPSSPQPRSVGTAGLARPTRDGAGPAAATAACDTRVAGNWSYSDQNGAWHNSYNFQVQVWDRDSMFGDDLLATGVTDYWGNYNLCFDAYSESWPDSGTADVYVLFISENSLWKVQNGGSPMSFTTDTVYDVVPGSTINFGSLTAADGTLQRGLHAFDEGNDAWQFIPKPTNLCFDQKDSSCRQLVINWSPTSTDGTYYSTGSNDVHLAADDPNGAITVVHEIGHFVMDDVYNDAFPPAPGCSPHSIQGTSSAGCAWTEGWAEWFPATVYNDPFFRWPNGAALDLENAGWHNGWGEGDTTEGRIAGALIDITDYANEAYWDGYGEGWSNIWYTFTHHVSNTLAQFWSSRAADGFNVADGGGLADLYQNTVDYGFRQPLGNYAPLTRPNPSPAQNYGYNTTTIYWSVVAIRPPAGADFDLAVYDDRAQSAYLSGSAYGGSVVDFVAVDGNLRPAGDYYPRVNTYAGSGTYQVELAQGAVVLSTGSSTISMGSSNIVVVRDTYLTAGSPVTITVTPQAGQDPELFLMGDNAGDSSTWIRPRWAAVATAGTGGAGAAETLTYTAPTSGWYGVVVINKAGSGSYTLTRS